MAYQIADLSKKVQKLIDQDQPRYRRLWSYYRNPMQVCASSIGDPASQRPYRQAQEWGMPARITGMRSGSDVLTQQLAGDTTRKEVVIENDIAWRIDTMVDYLFGKPLVIESAIEDPTRRNEITQLLRMILAHNGGLVFLQQLALLGSVYGFVDVLVKLQPSADGAMAAQPAADGLVEGQGVVEETRSDGLTKEGGAAGATPAAVGEGAVPATQDGSTDPGADITPHESALQRLARMIRFEIVEPARALPILSPEDWRVVNAYVQVWEKPGAKPQASIWNRLFASSNSSTVVEIITADSWQRFENEKLVAQGNNSLGVLPLAHVQNVAVPFEYSGISDVEPLIPLQDELNTRLSDRAHRITMQSFKMFLGKGIPNFLEMPVEPGRLWVTDNENASVQTFSGDEGCPSEENHLEDVRDAMDKSSSVSPIAAGAIKGKVGRLTSAAALRVTMQSLLAKTERKRTTYGAAIQRMCELALAWLDAAGVFKTELHERSVELHWPSPIPENDLERLQEAETKLRIGVAKDIVLRELGY